MLEQSLPHCPRCGSAPTGSATPGCEFCYECGFNDDCALYWRVAVRGELARQALELRAHAHYTRPSKYDGSAISDWPRMAEVQNVVSSQYEWLRDNPIRLPGDDK